MGPDHFISALCAVACSTKSSSPCVVSGSWTLQLLSTAAAAVVDGSGGAASASCRSFFAVVPILVGKVGELDAFVGFAVVNGELPHGVEGVVLHRVQGDAHRTELGERQAAVLLLLFRVIQPPLRRRGGGGGGGRSRRRR